jgi:hypothetical protein
LTKVGPIEIKKKLLGADAAVLYWTAYLISLADGRFAFGFSDGDGNTRSIYLARPIAHEVLLGDEALQEFRKRKAKLGH